MSKQVNEMMLSFFIPKRVSLNMPRAFGYYIRQLTIRPCQIQLPRRVYRARYLSTKLSKWPIVSEKVLLKIFFFCMKV